VLLLQLLLQQEGLSRWLRQNLHAGTCNVLKIKCMSGIA
jgi:hypothetical protein